MIKSSQITIKDIARELKVSASTVSRALKNHPDISQATKDAVMALAKKMDYQPNSIALSLRKSKSHTIGVIIPQIVHHFFSSAISGIEEVAHNKGYSVLFCQSNESYKRELENTKTLMSSRVDGFIISLSRETKNFDHFKNIHNKGVPMVFFDRVCDELETSKIVVDDEEGAFSAVEHLISIGCKRIAHIKGPSALNISQFRLNGYLEALKRHHIEVKDELIVKGGLSKESGYKMTKQLLELPEPPDAIFCFNDPLAIGALMAIKESKFKAPDDVAVVGFSDEPAVSLLDPPLTTVAQPSFDMGKLATQRLFQQVENLDTYEPKKEVLKTTLIIRGSSMRTK